MKESSGGGDVGVIIVILLILVIGLYDSATGRISGSAARSYKPPESQEEIQRELERINQNVGEIKKEQQKNALIGERSPLFGKIYLSASSIWSDDPNQEYVEISFGRDLVNRALLTGMEIRSSISGRGVVIGEGVYQPGFPGITNEEPIFANPGDRIYLVSGRSPLGYSFRTNKCTGYFEQSHDFTPSLSFDCPGASSNGLPSITQNFRNACYNYIESLPSCFMPTDSIPEDIGPDCAIYVTSKINYKTCVEKHRLDFDFYKPEWRVYLNRPEELWDTRREFIKLLDQNKKTIDYEEIQ